MDKDAAVRINAALALWRIDGEIKATVPILCAALKDRADNIRQRAAESLAAIGPPAKDAFVPLARTLKDPNLSVRKAVTLALKTIDPKAAAKIGVRK
jgi:HEAT repeat protein